MGAGGRRGLTRASRIIALPAPAFLSLPSHQRGLWLQLPSCPRWPPGCSGPHRTAAAAIVPSTSRQFGKRVGCWISAESRGEPSAGGRLGSGGSQGTSSQSISDPGGGGHRERCGGAMWQPSAAAASDLGARSTGWAVRRSPPFGSLRLWASPCPVTSPPAGRGPWFGAKALAGSGAPRCTGAYGDYRPEPARRP